VREPALVSAGRQAATVMLGVPADGRLTPPDADEGAELFDRALARAAALLGTDALRRVEFGWLSETARFKTTGPDRHVSPCPPGSNTTGSDRPNASSTSSEGPTMCAPCHQQRAGSPGFSAESYRVLR